MLRASAVLFTSLLLLNGCDDGGSSGDVKTASVADEKADTPAKPTEAKPTEVKPEAGGGGGADEVAKKKAEEAERQKKRAEALAKLEEWKAKEAARWNDELTAKVKELVETDFADVDAALTAIVGSPHRDPENVPRDEYRHPAETLAFFGVKPTMTVVEVGPGGGWYTEILAPLLAKNGKLVVTHFDPNGPEDDGRTLYGKRFQAFMDRSEVAYGKIEAIIQKDKDKLDLGAPESADMVLIIRGLHGRVNRGEWDTYMKAAHSTLKPGGILGIVQHRANEGADLEASAEKGYLPEAWVIAEIEKAGFKLEEKSEINANPKDTKDYEEGVWALPPTLTMGDTDRAKYVEIGESDRMTLRFKKI